MDLASTIVPKSTQLNSDDLISGPRTIKITSVTPGADDKQPVNIHFEGDDNRPYIPSKTMRRVLVVAWGSKSDVYVGRRLTLYRDPTVKFGGDVVGGIKISHMSNIDSAKDLMLTETRGKRKPHRVEPLEAEAAPTLTDLPEAWEAWTNEERGTNRASKGTALLQEWWATLSAADKKTLKPRLDADWKKIAEGVK